MREEYDFRVSAYFTFEGYCHALQVPLLRIYVIWLRNI